MSAPRPDRGKTISIKLGGVTHVLGTVLPKDIIKRIADLNKKMREDYRDSFADEVGAIWDMCESAFAAEFDAGYEHAQLTVKEWLEPPEGVRS